MASRDVTATPEEEEAIEAMRGGDIQGLGAVFGLHHDRALRMAVALTGNPDTAKDVVSDAFLAAYSSISNFKPGCSFERWFRGIVRHRVQRLERDSARLVAGPRVDALLETTKPGSG
jgi:DNA-directed RNA polymerase specialized sigma24 family protein